MNPNAKEFRPKTFYECSLQCYVILRICQLLWNKPEQIKTLIGMCESNYQLKKHVCFLSSRPHKMIFPFFRVFSRQVECLQDSFASEKISMVNFIQTMFVNTQIEEGIFLWTVLLEFTIESAYRIGISPPSLLYKFRNAVLGDVDGSCSLCFSLNRNHKLCASLWGVVSNLPKGKIEVPDKFVASVVVGVEINVSKQVLSFFVNKKKLCYGISHIYSPSHVGISGYDKQTFTSLSFCRLPEATPSPVKCKLFQCKPI